MLRGPARVGAGLVRLALEGLLVWWEGVVGDSVSTSVSPHTLGTQSCEYNPLLLGEADIELSQKMDGVHAAGRSEGAEFRGSGTTTWRIDKEHGEMKGGTGAEKSEGLHSASACTADAAAGGRRVGVERGWAASGWRPPEGSMLAGRLHGRISNVFTFVWERVARWLMCSVSVVVTIAIALLGNVMKLFGYSGTFAAFGYSGTFAHYLRLVEVDSSAGNRRVATEGSSRGDPGKALSSRGALLTGRARGGGGNRGGVTGWSGTRRGAVTRALLLCALLTEVDACNGSRTEADGSRKTSSLEPAGCGAAAGVPASGYGGCAACALQAWAWPTCFVHGSGCYSFFSWHVAHGSFDVRSEGARCTGACGDVGRRCSLEARTMHEFGCQSAGPGGEHDRLQFTACYGVAPWGEWAYGGRRDAAGSASHGGDCRMACSLSCAAQLGARQDRSGFWARGDGGLSGSRGTGLFGGYHDDFIALAGQCMLTEVSVLEALFALPQGQ